MGCLFDYTDAFVLCSTCTCAPAVPPTLSCPGITESITSPPGGFGLPEDGSTKVTLDWFNDQSACGATEL